MKKLFKKLTKRTILAILALIVIGVPLLYLTVLNQKEVKASWFDDNFSYRKAITVTVTSSASDISNLETLLTVDTTGITANLQTNCEDLRFTSVGGNVLPYYAPSCSDNSATNKIWVQADLVPKNTTTYTMYMYYGNPTAPAASDSTKFDNVVGLVGYWTTNESSWNGTSGEVKDSSVNGNNGTGNGGVSTTTGQYSNAGNYDGTNDFVNVGDPAGGELDFAVPGATVAYWIKFDTLAASTLYDPLAKADWNGSAWVGLFTEVNGSTGVLNMSVADGSTSSGVSTTVTTATWYHITFVWELDGTTAMYVNGAKVSTGAAFTGSAATAFSLRFGRNSQYVTPRYLDGLMDDIRMYSRALSGSEVSQLYTTPGTIATTATGTSGPSTAFATEEKAPSPVAYWKFDDPSAGSGLVAQDSTQNNNDGTISGATWQTEDQCIAGKCLYFDGTNDVVTVSNTVSGIQTVSLWIRPMTTSEQIIDINGTASISVSSGTISATSFSSPTIYVNGKVSSTLVANTWQYVTVTTGTALSGSAIKIGQISTNYGQAFIDDVKLYPYARTAAQILTDYASRGSVKGSSSVIGSDPQNNAAALSNGLVGYWKMNESSGNAIDSSGNGSTLTNNNSTSFTTGKFGNAPDLNGSNQSFSVSDNAVLSSGDIDMTVCAWVYMDSQTVNHRILAKGDNSGDTREWLLNYNNSTNRFQFHISGNGTSIISVTADTFGAVSTSTWYFVCGYHNAANDTFGISVNGGTLDTAATSGTAPSDRAGAFKIGEENGVYWDGRIDEARYYKRLLSSADITALYNFAPGPVGYWNLDENTGTSANDSSGNARTGTINGNPIWAPGKYGAGVKMDGTGDNIQVSDF